MKHCLQASELSLAYVEDKVSDSILWESHCHIQFEMIAVLEGDISILLEGHIYRLQEKQCLIIPPLAYHRVMANEKGNYRRVTALFSQELIPGCLQPAFFENKCMSTNVCATEMEHLKSICQKENTQFYTPLAESIMVQIFYACLQEASMQASSEADAFLQTVLSYIDAHICEKISLEQLALYTARSKSSFCHLFEQKMNLSPKQYILQKKLALADKLISEGTVPTLAAMQVGYDNYSNFYRMYLKFFKTSPTKRYNTYHLDHLPKIKRENN